MFTIRVSPDHELTKSSNRKKRAEQNRYQDSRVSARRILSLPSRILNGLGPPSVPDGIFGRHWHRDTVL